MAQQHLSSQLAAPRAALLSSPFREREGGRGRAEETRDKRKAPGHRRLPVRLATGHRRPEPTGGIPDATSRARLPAALFIGSQAAEAVAASGRVLGGGRRLEETRIDRLLIPAASVQT